MGDRANHVGCTVCGDQIEARDLEQADETHAMLVEGHDLKVSVELTAPQVAWLHELVSATAKVAADGEDAEHAGPVSAELARVWTVS